MRRTNNTEIRSLKLLGDVFILHFTLSESKSKNVEMDILIRSRRISRRIFAGALLRYRPEKEKYSPHFLEDVFIFRISFAFIVQILHSIFVEPWLITVAWPSLQCRSLHRKIVEEYSEMRFFFSFWLLLLFGFAFSHSHFLRRLSEFPLALRIFVFGRTSFVQRSGWLGNSFSSSHSLWIFAFSMFSRNAKLLFGLGYCYCNDFLCTLWANEWMHGVWRMERIECTLAVMAITASRFSQSCRTTLMLGAHTFLTSEYVHWKRVVHSEVKREGKPGAHSAALVGVSCPWGRSLWIMRSLNSFSSIQLYCSIWMLFSG